LHEIAGTFIFSPQRRDPLAYSPDPFLVDLVRSDRRHLIAIAVNSIGREVAATENRRIPASA